MAEGWRGEAQQAVEILLLGNGEEEVASSDYLGDAHERVVHDDGELVGPCAVASAEDEVAALVCKMDGVVTVVAVSEGEGLVRHGKSCRPHGAEAAFTVEADVAETLREGVHSPAVGLVGSLCRHDFGTCAVAGVCVPSCLEPA